MMQKTALKPVVLYGRTFVRPRKRAAVTVEDEYQKLLNGLSYKQLLRINSAVTADTEGEKAASRLFFRSLTPPENKVVKMIESESNLTEKKKKIDVLNESLQQKNRAEIADIDVIGLINSARLQNEF